MLVVKNQNIFSRLARNLVIIATGLLILLDGSLLSKQLLQVTGVILSLIGLISIINFAFIKKTNIPLGSIFDALVGFIIYTSPDSISSLVIGSIGFVLILLAIVRLFMLVFLSSTYRDPISVFLSILLLLVGMSLILSDFGQAIISLVAGALICVYGINSLLRVLLTIRKKESTYSKNSKTTYETKVENDRPKFTNNEDIDTSGISQAKEVEYKKED